MIEQCARGRATFCAVDASDRATRDILGQELRRRSLHIGGCGYRFIRFRPALILEERHVDQLDGMFRDVLQWAQANQPILVAARKHSKGGANS